MNLLLCYLKKNRRQYLKVNSKSRDVTIVKQHDCGETGIRSYTDFVQRAIRINDRNEKEGKVARAMTKERGSTHKR